MHVEKQNAARSTDPVRQPPGPAPEGFRTETNGTLSRTSSVIQRARLDPKSLTPKEVLYLQRTIGNRAVNRLLAGKDQKQPGAGRVIQRRIGFEVETGIPLTKKKVDKGKTTYEGLFVSDVKDDLKVEKGKLSPDHIPGDPKHAETDVEEFEDWPIIELVTDPIDDTLPLDQFEAIAKKWIKTLKDIKTEAKATPPAKQYKDDYHIGLPTAQAYNSWDRIAPQVTVGVPLDQVGKILAGFNVTSGTTPQFNADKYGKESPKVAATIMQNLLDKYPTGDGAGVQALKGLLVLMCNYLLVGKDPAIANVIYMKNRPSNIFYKTKLSTVQQNIVGQSFPSQILTKPAGLKLLKEQLLAVTGRDAGEALFIEGKRVQKDGLKGAASDVSVGDWIDEVLTGTDDKIFDEMKNEWSTEIAPDAGNEVIIELRRIGDFVLHNNYDLEDDKGLLDFMKKVYLANKAYKQRTI
jgi:hypothetical protein